MQGLQSVQKSRYCTGIVHFGDNHFINIKESDVIPIL